MTGKAPSDRPAPRRKDDPAALDFEQALAQVEEIIARIESGEVGLERSIAEYERGATLIRRCREILQTAEQKVEDLTARMQADEAAAGKPAGRRASRPATDDGKDAAPLMPDYEVVFFFLKLTWLLFVVAFGCCIGSLINVIVYRMPRGMSIVRPPSRCPACNTRLTFRENIPVLGWFIWRGKCRYCKAPISPEYPIVEATVGALFGLFFALWYALPPDWLGVHWAAWRPEWALNDWSQVWPIFAVVVVLVGSLVAMTLVDARTSTIPLALCWFPSAIALLAHPAAAAWVEHTAGHLRRTAPGAVWSIPTPAGFGDGWRWVGLAFGACLGLAISTVLLRFGLITRSFADYEEWEQSLHAQATPEGAPSEGATGRLCDPCPPSTGVISDGVTDRPDDLSPAPSPGQSEGAPSASERVLNTPDDTPAPLLAESRASEPASSPAEASFPSDPSHSPLPSSTNPIEAFAPTPASPRLSGSRHPRRRALDPAPVEPPRSPEETWIQYPHARREMWKELTFLAPAAALAWLGWHAAGWAGLTGHPGGSGALAAAGTPIPLWLQVLTGVLLGYLIGGAVVWAVRILGSMAFGKEAMGLGDVHLMAAVGACVGWIDAVLAFFAAAFVGVFWALLGRLFSGVFRRAMPYGPFLAIATVLVLLLKPLFEAGLSRILGGRPINLP